MKWECGSQFIHGPRPGPKLFKTLFICTAAGSGPGAAEARKGRIEYCRVDVPGAGLP